MPLKNSTLYKVAGTKFLRLASAQILERWGANLQNVEKGMRSIYVPHGFDITKRTKVARYLRGEISLNEFTQEERRATKLMVQVDQSGAEALIVAYLARPGRFRELFLNGVKPHVFVALHNFTKEFERKNPAMADLLSKAVISKIGALKSLDGWKELDAFIKDSDNWPAQERYYFIAKMICHASNYDMKAPTFQINVLEKSEGKIVLSRQQAEQSLNTYHTLFPEIREWHQWCREQVMKDGHIIYNLQGYPITFTTQLNESDMKDVYAAAPQSTVGTITNIAYTNMQQYIEKERRNWDMLGNCHDSMLSQCPIGDEAECSKVMKELMEQDLVSPRNEKFKMKSEAQVGYNWSPAKNPPKDANLDDDKIINKYNLDGLRELKF